MNANKSEVESVNTGQLSEKLIRKQANPKDKINELESFIKESPKSSTHKHQVTTLGENVRLSRTQIAELKNKTIKNFITFIFALILFGAVTYLLYLAL